jgi:DNA damage-binding protein 1
MGEQKERSSLRSVNDSVLTLPPDLVIDCSASGHICCLYVKTRGDYVLAGDLMRSMTLYQYKHPQNSNAKGTLEEIARDYDANAMRSIEILPGTVEGDVYLGSDHDGNIFTMQRLIDVTDEERLRLNPIGYYHLGDPVQVFRHGSLNTQPADPSLSSSDDMSLETLNSVLFGTVTGAIGAVLSLDDRAFRFFSALERAIRTIVTG